MPATVGPNVAHEHDALVPWLGAKAAQFAADACWLCAVVAALDVIDDCGVLPDAELVAGVLMDACRAVSGVVVMPTFVGAAYGPPEVTVLALASVASQFTTAVGDELASRASGSVFGLDDVRASLYLGAEIVSLAARQALWITRQVNRDRRWRRLRWRARFGVRWTVFRRRRRRSLARAGDGGQEVVTSYVVPRPDRPR